MNVGSIVDKYFSDTLVEAKKIADDHFGHVVFISFSFGGVCPLDGHAIAKIHILKEETTPMKVFLELEDLQEALDNYVIDSIGLKGATGVNIILEDSQEPEFEVLFYHEAPTSKSKNRGGHPKGSRNKAKSAPETKEEVSDDSVENTTEGSSDTPDTAGSESTEADSSNGEKQPATKVTETKSTKTGNLFGDEESQSSESAETTTSNSAEEKTPARKVTTKKSSIFDA